MKSLFKNILILSCLTFLMFGCKKYLDLKSDKWLTVAETLQDAQSLLDDYRTINRQSTLSEGMLMDDNYFITDAYYDKINLFQQGEFVWNPDAAGDDYLWKSCYQYIAQANVSLETLGKLNPTSLEQPAFNLAKGSALYLRAFCHHQVALIYALQYEKAKAANTIGIPYKKTSDINNPTVRSSLQQNFDDIILDLKTAAALLPDKGNPVSRPSKAASFGMLARVYLSMNDYDNSLKYADSSLAIYNTLVNYNTLANPSTTASVTALAVNFNAEVIHHMTGQATSLFSTTNYICDTTLYSSFVANDLRKSFFFVASKNQPNTFAFRGSYDASGSSYPVAGIVTDEMYITKAECLARTGNFSGAMDVLNSLLVNRWKTNTFQKMTATDKDDAVKKILIERRKELVARNNIRWMDIKRLNLDPNYAITLTRKVKGVTYTLPPNDLRYALLIPITVIQNSGIEQNKR